MSEDGGLRPLRVIEPAHFEETEREGVARGGDALLQIQAPAEELVNDDGKGDAEARADALSSVAVIHLNLDDVDVE
eukprot:scaffold126502_cov27-Tisochrysis_lutea.AAC.1